MKMRRNEQPRDTEKFVFFFIKIGQTSHLWWQNHTVKGREKSLSSTHYAYFWWFFHINIVLELTLNDAKTVWKKVQTF